MGMQLKTDRQVVIFMPAPTPVRQTDNTSGIEVTFKKYHDYVNRECTLCDMHGCMI